MELRAAEEARYQTDAAKFGAGAVGTGNKSSTAGREPPYAERYRRTHSRASSYASELDQNTLSDTSYYSKFTGERRRMADPRQPVKEVGAPDGVTGYAASLSSSSSSARRIKRVPVPNLRPPTPAEEYAMSVMGRNTKFGDGGKVGQGYNGMAGRGAWLEPTPTGSSEVSKNPFRRQ